MSKIERIKAETDGLDVLPELLRAARDGWETLSPEHVGLLKWYGLYAHNTGDGHFMMRVKVIQGKLTLAQVETMAGIAEEFGRGVIDCTTRQCFQIHWIRLENIIEIFDRLDRCGMTTSGACGDITRNVVGCTVSGLAHDEIVDGYATSEAIHGPKASACVIEAQSPRTNTAISKVRDMTPLAFITGTDPSTSGRRPHPALEADTVSSRRPAWCPERSCTR